MFRTVPLCPLAAAFHCKHSNGICHTGYTDSLQDQDVRPDPARKLYDIYPEAALGLRGA